MRILQFYRYLVGTKIPFDKWPGIVEEFLQQQNLSHRFFHYCLETYDQSARCRSVLDGSKCLSCQAPEHYCNQCRKEAADTLRKGTGCERAAKEHPFLGPLQVRETRYSTIHSLNNFSEASIGSKESIYSIISKLYRRYGFADTSLIYRDIDFFSRRVPSPAPDSEFLGGGYQGSGITLYRSCIGRDSAIMLVVESRYPGDVPDAAPYADALGAMLPGIRRISATTVIMDAEEQSRYDGLNNRVLPLVRQAKEFFDDRMPEEKGNDDPSAPANVASWLKKLCKRYGYAYLGYENFMYFAEKRLPGGHCICLEFVSNPLSPDADPFVNLCGLGFRHQIWLDGFSPQNPRDASWYLTKLFDTLAEAEQTVFPAILDLYPETPDWFMPTH